MVLLHYGAPLSEKKKDRVGCLTNALVGWMPSLVHGFRSSVTYSALVARALLPAGSRLVSTLVSRLENKRRDESRRGRHECLRHDGIRDRICEIED